MTEMIAALTSSCDAPLKKLILTHTDYSQSGDSSTGYMDVETLRQSEFFKLVERKKNTLVAIEFENVALTG